MKIVTMTREYLQESLQVRYQIQNQKTKVAKRWLARDIATTITNAQAITEQYAKYSEIKKTPQGWKQIFPGGGAKNPNQRQ